MRTQKIFKEDYYGYSENQGVINCKDCGEQLWTSIPMNGDIVECNCGCTMEFEIDD